MTSGDAPPGPRPLELIAKALTAAIASRSAAATVKSPSARRSAAELATWGAIVLKAAIQRPATALVGGRDLSPTARPAARNLPRRPGRRDR